ncbi:antilisterial bacteriocin subtilosin biosynthesis protein AlbA [Ruminiclostridium hungatei]|uniref:Antilisterial bacteriocin subtilosin biosynthesis protein AlbA n=1 Tax=Ruminiclostridium hungatei TaxID=48256 RepID=A0A1V4SMY4_RUMHU|nr:radical SAM protein [Ruminiclostridium hungatei]OPX44815.1 antilisterial bacteriocin subtilosin biosynthesis protein AlbA [Ruminiclostridium hungatei]
MSLDWKEFHRRITALSMEKGLPLSGSFELTARCNFKCKMCYVCGPANDKNMLKSELTTGQWIQMGRQARDAGLFYLILTGGEVFLREDFEKIYEALSEMGLNITIFTNGSLISPKRAKWLGRIPPHRVSVTVYGGSPETYERVAGNREGYFKTMGALEALRSEGINLEVKTTVVEGNHRDYKELYKIAHTYSNVLGVVNYISPRREGCGSDPLGNRLSPFDIVEYENRMSLYGQKMYPKSSKLELKMNADSMEQESVLSLKTQQMLEASAFRCQSGKTGFWLTWDGRMIPCGLLDTPSARPLETGFEKAWQLLKEGCGRVPKCSDCEACAIKKDCISCPGRLMSETGSFTRPAEYLCESARYRSLLRQERDTRYG